jgi:hypothetical protein
MKSQRTIIVGMTADEMDRAEFYAITYGTAIFLTCCLAIVIAIVMVP